MTQHLPTSQPVPNRPGRDRAENQDSLLAEVDFKWLMAGQGWWIDTARLRTDPSYCAGVLGLALASPCHALRECAVFLQTLASGNR